MPSLEELLDQQRVAYTILERVELRTGPTLPSRLWIGLGLLWFMSGVVLALSWSGATKAIHPSAALLLAGGVGILFATAASFQRERARGLKPTESR
jgi:hypothetical protein